MLGNMRDRIFSRCAERASVDEIKFFPGDVIENLLMFDCFIIDSIRLEELPGLIKLFGFGGLRDLIKLGHIKINCQAVTTGQILLDPKKSVLPIGSYEFSVIVSSNHKDYIHKCFKVVDNIADLKGKQKMKLKEIVSNSFIQFPNEGIKEYMEQLKKDILLKPFIIKTSLGHLVNSELNSNINPDSIQIDVKELSQDQYKIKSNLCEILNITGQEEHKLIERAVLTVAGSNQRLSQMKEFNCLSSFRIEDLPIIQGKFDFILDQFTTIKTKETLRKIINLKNVPDFRSAEFTSRFDVDQFLKLRESDECKLFRNWIWSLTNASDDEIVESIKAYRNTVGQYIRTPIGKTVRYLAGIGVGFIPVVGSALSSITGGIDTFLLERLFPVNGAMVFLDNKLPSIIKK